MKMDVPSLPNPLPPRLLDQRTGQEMILMLASNFDNFSSVIISNPRIYILYIYLK